MDPVLMRGRLSRASLARIHLAVLRENLVETRNKKRVKAHRARVIGNTPDPESEGVVFCACDDQYYARFGPDLALSAEATGHRHRIHIHLYAPSLRTLEHIDALRRSLDGTLLSYTWEDDGYRRYGVHPEIYFAAARFLMLHHLLLACRAPILCLDIDALIHRPLADAFATIRGADVSLYLRPEERRRWRRVLAAAVGVSFTKPSLGYCERTAHAIEAVLRQHPVYHIDQSVLYDTYMIRRQMKRRTRWQTLSPRFADYDFDDESFVWTAKGDRKEHARFVEATVAIRHRYADLYRALPRLMATADEGKA
jgi:hypothetical protein